ncbi:MAG: cation:proton antiporter [Glaciecola sp.]|jgi:CPA2 family monovalent cation:H+ antiporter-2
MPQEFISVISLMLIAVVSVWCCKRINLPPILAYLLAGLIVGPSMLNLFDHPEQMHVIAEIGIVFLLFSLGLEFSLPKLIAMRHLVFGLGAGQMVLTTAVFAGIAMLFGFAPAPALIIGGMIGLSSTAIVIKQTTEMGILNTPRSQLAVSILLFQDLAVVPFLIAIPLLNQTSDASLWSVMGVALVKAIVVIGFLLWAGKWLLPKVFKEVASTRTDELFVLTTIVTALIAAGLTYAMGLSLALGAFLAGMMLGESQYKHQIEADIRPFRDILMGLFFVTVGMRLELALVLPYWHVILVATSLMIVLKILIVRIAASIFKANAQDAWAAGIKLCQMGEFSFILAALAVAHAVLNPTEAGVLVTSGVLSMALTPFLVEHSVAFAKRLAGTNSAEVNFNFPDISAPTKEHVIILGFGRVGQSAARMLTMEKIPYIAIDVDPIRVQESLLAAEPIIFGDVSQKSILRDANIENASSVVLTFDQTAKAVDAIHTIRGLHASIPIIVRTRKDYDLDKLYQAGASQVVPEIQEGSLMLVSQIYHYSGVPMNRILKRIQAERRQGYDHLHGVFPGETTQVSYENADKLQFMHAITISDSAWAVDRPLADCDLGRHGIKVKKLQRQEHEIMKPRLDTIVQAGDVLVISGKPRRVERAERKILDGH